MTKTWLRGYLQTKTNYHDVDQIIALWEDLGGIMPGWFDAALDSERWQAAVNDGRIERVELDNGKHGYRVKGDGE